MMVTNLMKAACESVRRACGVAMLLAVLLVMVVLGGCATQTELPEDSKQGGAVVTDESSGDQNDSEAAQATAAAAEAEIPERPFGVDTFYALLVAEVASERQRYDVWLGNYIQEAHRTRDPGVTARAARIARLLGAHQAALNAAMLWLELEPNNSEAIYMATVELANVGRLLESFQYSEKLLRKGSTPIFQSIAARAAQVTDTQYEALMQEFERLLQEYPNDPQLLLGKATLLQLDKQYDAALLLVRQVLDDNPQDITAAIVEARLLTQLGDTENALQRLLTLLQQNPDNQRLRLQYARLLAGIDLQEAKRQFEILVQQNPNDPDLIYSLALVANELGETDLARSAFAQLLIMGAYQDSSHYYLGRIAEAGEDFPRALEHYKQVENGPDFLPALSRSIEIMIRLGQMDEAHNRIVELQAQFPDQTAQLILFEAQALAKFQHLQKAEALLTDALTFDPNNSDLLYTRAMINEQRNLIDLMESDLRSIIRYQPNNAAALNALGYVLANRTTRYEEAHELIRKALDIKPDDPAIIDSMGWVQFRLGNYEEAIIRLRQAFQSFPDHEIAAHLGEVLWVSGEREEALRVWEDALKLNPASTLIPEVMERLDAQPQSN